MPLTKLQKLIETSEEMIAIYKDVTDEDGEKGRKISFKELLLVMNGILNFLVALLQIAIFYLPLSALRKTLKGSEK